ncbi:MAG: acetoacetate decarboxylase family protein [Candidatus Bathyarchaeota archaeon]|nr:acetoacetate decarboxylase family protein [Candidatus Bathyarchaeota archaeon]MDH5418949.1 acetoacetate decarboxylase family protein [Candidatus Bathyarchaeota archaeon]MDH5623555.1 acetoacetate decarboxylase family protein [Candidatus Bathyarchaeota archaeon]MDH5636531.1 acetoacetate decarboxylase family protein [Candidatus Bathyarchaeota archaeon]MDH5701392.1 acetoacetate decarboxylase family protein [Candidatus Bathyarchaeota archaeon]
MGLVRSLDEISAREEHFSKGFVLGDAVMVMVMFRTNAEAVKRVLPPPLEPDPASIGSAYVAEFRRTNFGVTYNEAALFISAQYEGEVGNYCLSMPVTNDIAMIGGREVYGFPKKIAETIRVRREGNKVTGVCIRKGIPIIEIKVNLTGAAEPEDIPPQGPNYLFKYFEDPKIGAFDYNPRLVKQYNEIDWGKPELGEGELTLAKSKFDPIHEIPIEEVLMAGYAKGMEIRMQPGEVIAEVDPLKFRPYSFIKLDWEL